MHFVLTHPERKFAQRVNPGLGTENPVVFIAVDQRAPIAINFVNSRLGPIGVLSLFGAVEFRLQLEHRLERVPAGRGVNAGHSLLHEVGKPGLFDEPVGNIHPKPVDPTVEPEAQNLEKLVSNPGVLPVEVGLRRVEQVQVPLAGCAFGGVRAGPCRPAKCRLPRVGGFISGCAPAVSKNVAVALGAAGIRRQRLAKPGVFV